MHKFQLVKAIRQFYLGRQIIDRKRLSKPFVRPELFMWYSVGQLFCIMAVFKCALYKNNYATPRLADVRFHVYATRTIKRPFAAQIIADAPMHSLNPFFLPYSVSLSLSLSLSLRVFFTFSLLLHASLGSAAVEFQIAL